ncbi:MAG TPA: hypothetical protein P5084_05955 [Paludibacter sp.]|nr:hypothetical protein [Paludibacter sp.]
MKRIFLIVIIINFFSSVTFGQEIELKGIYAGSSSKRYNMNIGYGIGYYQNLKSKNRLGISITHHFSNRPYDDIHISTEDGISTFIEKIEPNNQRIAVKMNYAFKLVDNPKSSIFLGPEFGLNYFLLRKKYYRIANENISGGTFTSSFNLNNRPSLGFLFEFELKEIISEKISLYLSLNPEITSFLNFGMMGGYDPYFVGWMNSNFGIRYLIND